MSQAIRILIADDFPVVRKGLRETIEETAGLQVVAEVADGQTALAQILALQPQVAILDIQMPKLGGFDVVRQLRVANVETAIILLTMYDDEATFRTALQLNVAGFVSKTSALLEIVASIQAVAAGASYISPALSKHVIRHIADQENLLQQFPHLNDLTPTERQVLRLIATGKTSNEIGQTLNIHPRTVDNHRTNISHKLALHGTHALVKFAIEHKNELP